MNTVILNGHDLTLEHIYDVALHHAKIRMDPDALTRAQLANELLYHKVKDNTPIYGTNRGVGQNKDRLVKDGFFDTYNRNLLRSHSLCVAPYCSEAEVRALLLLRLNSALYGCTGLAPEVLQRYADFLNLGIHPCLPRRGSVGESDLSINAMVGLSMIGESDVYYHGTRMSAAEALSAAGLKPLTLGPKDGLGMVSSNSQSAAMAALLLKQVRDLMANANMIFCLSMEGLNGQLQQLDPDVTAARGYKAQTDCANNFLNLLSGSYLFDEVPGKALQDPLSFRDAAFVNGAVTECIDLLEQTLVEQINHSDDNPCILPNRGSAFVSSNFEPLNLVLKAEMLNIALNHLSKCSCQRMLKLSDPTFSGLPRFLSPDGGATVIAYSTIQKTFMSLDAENRSLANPSSMDFFALAGYIEDHASNSILALTKTGQIIDNLRYILGMELMHAAQAIDLRHIPRQGQATAKAFQRYRQSVPFLAQDRNLSIDIQSSYELVRDNALIQ